MFAVLELNEPSDCAGLIQRDYAVRSTLGRGIGEREGAFIFGIPLAPCAWPAAAAPSPPGGRAQPGASAGRQSQKAPPGPTARPVCRGAPAGPLFRYTPCALGHWIADPKECCQSWPPIPPASPPKLYGTAQPPPPAVAPLKSKAGPPPPPPRADASGAPWPAPPCTARPIESPSSRGLLRIEQRRGRQQLAPTQNHWK